MLEYFRRRTDLDDTAEVHHGDAIGDMFHHRQVVGDENHRELHLAREVAQEVQNLCLDGDVERGDRFIGDDELGLDGQCAGDGDALALATGKLVGIFAHEPRGQTHFFHQRADRPGQVGLGHFAMYLDRLGEHRVHRHAWVERGIWILKNHLEIGASGAQFLAAQVGEGTVAESDGALGGLDELQDGTAQCGFAAAGLADEAKHLALGQAQRHAVNCLDCTGDFAEQNPFLHREVGLQVINLEVGVAHRLRLEVLALHTQAGRGVSLANVL